MSKDIKGIIRIIAGYSKIPDEGGDKLMEVEYVLKPLKLSFLQQLFNINPNDPDPVMRDMIYRYRINKEQAEVLQPYVIDGVIDLNEHDYMLDSYEDTENIEK